MGEVYDLKMKTARINVRFPKGRRRPRCHAFVGPWGIFTIFPLLGLRGSYSGIFSDSIYGIQRYPHFGKSPNSIQALRPGQKWQN